MINIRALAALARTNKHLSSATLAFLYKDPYWLAALSHHDHGRDASAEDSVTRASFRLTRMLLCCQPTVVAANFPTYLSLALRISDTYVQPESNDDEDEDEDMAGEGDWNSSDAVSEKAEESFLRAVSVISGGSVDELDGTNSSDGQPVEKPLDGTDDEQETPPSSQDYLSYIRHLNMDQRAIDMTTIWPEWEGLCRYPVSFEDYVTRCHADELKRSLYNIWNLRKLYHILLYQEATWALANPILEQLQSLYIPVSDIRRYLGAVGRLSVLETARFIMESTLVGEIRGNEEREAAVANKQEILKLAVEFVQEHTRIFPALLKTAVFSDGDFWIDIDDRRREETELKVFQILPPLTGVTSLTHHNLPAYLAHPLSTDLSHVKDIILGPKDKVDDCVGLLQRCRSLKSLNIDAIGKGAFKWAVEAKRRVEAQTRVNSARGDHNVFTKQGKELITQHELAPLAKIAIREDKGVLHTDELDDIAFAYSSTLEKISAFFSLDILLPRTIHIGQGWVDLLVLKQIAIFVARGALILDPLLLSHCPTVRAVEFRDITLEYRCRDIVSCQPARLENIRRLVLVGWSALTFHPDTLHSTRNLRELRLLAGASRRSDRHFIPPVDDLERSYGTLYDTASTTTTTSAATTTETTPSESVTLGIIRPHWSWNWDLPKLTILRLNGEFAFRFQFRMLRECPALIDLNLDIRSGSELQHTRVLTIADLFMPSTSDDPATKAKTSLDTCLTSERIVAPNIREVVMNGAWVVGDGVDMSAKEFLKDMFPHLE
ncbi:hypothetical protein BGX24_005373 [Mortierella sp. AD032]|nr:hypothetical protein BGX24_005373 [Mortierella sp. AD032]